MTISRQSRRALRAGFSFALILLLPCAWAGTVPTIYNYESYGNTLDGPLGNTVGTCASYTYVSTTLSVSNCAPAAGVVMSASSLATFDALHVQSSLALSNVSLPAGITSSGYARTSDTLDIHVSSSLGSTGVEFVGFTFEVDGMLADSGLTNALVTLNFGFAYDSGFAGQTPDGCSRTISSGSRTYSFTCATRLYNVALFRQNPYWFSMSAQEHNAPTTGTVSGSASASFFNTARITSVQPYDASMTFVPDAVISSVGNGGTPFVNAAAVPEPSTLYLFAGGLALLGLGRRYRGRRISVHRAQG